MSIRFRGEESISSAVTLCAQRGQLCRQLTQEHQHGAHPLQGADGVGKEDHRGQNGEELASCRDDGAGQGAKIHHRHEDETLQRRRAWGSAWLSGIRHQV